MADRIGFSFRKPVTTGSFLVVALVAAALFVPTFSAHVAVMNTVSIDATPTDYALSDDGDHIVVQIRVDNPTRSAFTARYGDLYGKIDGERVTGFGMEVEEATIQAGGTGTVTARVSVEEGHREQVADAVESGELSVSGLLQGTIRDEQVEIEIMEGQDG